MSRRRFAFNFSGLVSGAFVAASLAFGAVAHAEDDLGTQISKRVSTITAQSRDAVCRIEADDDHGRISGTGFLVDADGTLFTSYSIGGTADDFVVTVAGEKYPATRLLADPRSGIAILRADAAKPLPFLRCAKAPELALSSPVIVLGYPLTLPMSPSLGLVAGFEIGFGGRYFATRHIRANVPVQRGEGGAPVLNFKGQVVGVLISTVEQQSGIFALPIDAASKVLNDYRNFGRIRQGWLGADIRMTAAPEHGSAARVRDVRKNSPGFAGGMRPGDVILDVADWKITNPEDVLNASFYISPDEPLKLRVSRAGKIYDLTVTPSESPNGELPRIERKQPAFLGAAELSPDK